MTGPLADWHDRHWPLPPAFRRTALPWFAVANRQAWIAGDDYPPPVGQVSNLSANEYPLVEEIDRPQTGAGSLHVVLSYLPWQDQLGRCETADELFVKLLTATAKGAKDRRPLDGRWRLLYPPAKEIKADERPVLAAALKSAETPPGDDPGETTPRGGPAIVRHGPIRGYVLDLRGKTPPPRDLIERSGGMKEFEARIGTGSPLLILGDSPILDTWKWLELDQPYSSRSTEPYSSRSAVMSPSASPRLRPGVLWWRDNSLPPSRESQLRLMQLFTEWNVFLGDIPQETSNEDRK